MDSLFVVVGDTQGPIEGACINSVHSHNMQEQPGTTILASENQVRANMAALDALKPQMEDLKRLVSNYISTVQDALLKRRTTYQMRLSQLKSVEVKLKSDIEMNKRLREQLLEELSSEMRNKDQSSVKVEEMKIQQENLERQKKDFSRQLEEIESQISEKMRAISEQREVMKNQTFLVNDKLFQFEQLLGMRIEQSRHNIQNPAIAENAKDDDDDDDDDDDVIDAVTFTFKNVDPNDFSNEVSFIFDPEKVEILSSDPVLPRETYSEAIRIFTTSKEIGYLWKFMRSALRSKLLSSSPTTSS